MTASHGPASDSLARSAASARSPRERTNPYDIRPRQAAVEGSDLPSEAEGGANDGMADESGAAQDEQTHVNIVPA